MANSISVSIALTVALNRRIAGTSGGSIVAGLLAAGVPMKKVRIQGSDPSSGWCLGLWIGLRIRVQVCFGGGNRVLS